MVPALHKVQARDRGEPETLRLFDLAETPQPETGQLWLPGIGGRQQTAVPGWLLDIFDRAGGRSIGPGRGDPKPLGLLRNPAKAQDPRAAEFVAKYGELVQVEVEAVHPDELRRLYEAAFSEWWNMDIYEAVLDHERMVSDRLEDLADEIADQVIDRLRDAIDG